MCGVECHVCGGRGARLDDCSALIQLSQAESWVLGLGCWLDKNFKNFSERRTTWREDMYVNVIVKPKKQETEETGCDYGSGYRAIGLANTYTMSVSAYQWETTYHD